METLRKLTKTVARLMAGCLLLATLLPTLSAASAEEGALHAVCSAQGMKWVDDTGREVAGPGAKPSVPGQGLSLTDHCPMCLIEHTCSAPAPHDPKPAVMEPRGAAMPSAWLHAPRTAAVWLSGLSRGPPRLG